jgi:hypothetical protein
MSAPYERAPAVETPRKALAGLVVLLLLVTGCTSVAERSGPTGFTAAAMEAGRQALDRLARLPALSAAVELPESALVAGGGRLDVVTTKHGVVMATGRLGNDRFRTIVLDHRVFVVAPAKYWKRQGYAGREARRYAGKPVLFHRKELGIDPASQLNPGAFATELKRVLDSPATTVERVAGGKDGADRYRFETPNGTLDVLAEGTPRVAAAALPSFVDQLPLDLRGKRRKERPASFIPSAGAYVGTIPLHPEDVALKLIPEEIQPWVKSMKDFGTLLELLHDVVLVARDRGTVRVTLEPGTTNCLGGNCFFTMRVSAEPKSKYWELSSVWVTLQMTASNPVLGQRRCGTSVRIFWDGKAVARCQASFRVPRSRQPRIYPIRSRWFVTGNYPQWKPNLDEINQLYAEHTKEYVFAYYDYWCEDGNHPKELEKFCSKRVPSFPSGGPTLHGIG